MALSRMIGPGWRVFLVAALLFAGASCSDQRAIELVQRSNCEEMGLWSLFIPGVSDWTWQDCLEYSVTEQGGILEDWTWRSSQSFENRREGEWFVSYTDPSGKGMFFIANLMDQKVILVNEDLITAERIGFLQTDERPVLAIDITHAEWKRDAKGAYYEIKGVATNSTEPIIELDAEVEIAVRIGDQALKGDTWWSKDPDPFRHTSTESPWPVGQSRTFCYRSDRIPAVYLDTKEPGQGVAVFEVSTRTISRSRLSERLHVDRFSWPPF